MKPTTFNVGQTVISVCGYNWLLTKGKEYTVIKVEPECRSDNGSFTWPEYVTVIGDFGEPVTGHTYRFKAKD